MAEHPPADPRLAQQRHEQALGRRVRPVGRRRDQPAGRRRSLAAHVAAVAPVQHREPHVPLQRPVEERGAVRQRHRRLQRGEGLVGEPQIPGADQVGEREITAPEHDAGLRPQVRLPRHRHLDLGRRAIEHAVPEGRRRSRHRRRFTSGPQPRGANPDLVGPAVAADEVDRGMEPLPRPVPCPALHRVRGHPARHGLRRGDDACLAREETLKRHRASIRRDSRRRGRSAELVAMISICGAGAAPARLMYRSR
jgi:hypothetical protein